MFLILGLIILIVAAIIAVAGVLTNLGSAHELTNDFSVFGYHVTSSTGALFLYGIVVGAAGLIGLFLLLAATRRAVRRDRSPRRLAKRESAVVDRERDDLIQQRDIARAEADAAQAKAARARAGQDPNDDQPATSKHHRRWFPGGGSGSPSAGSHG